MKYVWKHMGSWVAQNWHQVLWADGSAAEGRLSAKESWGPAVKHGGDLLPGSGLNNICNTIREECSRAPNVCCSRTVIPNVSVGGADPGSQHYGTSLGLHEEAEGFQEACSRRWPAVGSPRCGEEPCWEYPSETICLEELRLYWRQRVARPTRAWV